MPSRNTVKEDLPEGVYHAFNRGVERRQIFLDQHDYRRFKAQVKQSLASEPALSLWAYCLMPNHFHLIVHQSEAKAMGHFMQRLTIAYVMYFNRRYRRVGPLFQGKYKAVRIIDARQLMEESRYIHLNPERAHLGWRQHQHSSKHQYLDGTRKGVANPAPILELFDVPSDYRHYLSIAKVRSRYGGSST